MSDFEKLPLKFSWIYLINLIFFFLPLFFHQFLVWQYVAMATGLGVFLFLYFRAYRGDRASMPRYAAGIALVGAVLAYINPGAISMLSFTGFFLGYALPFRRSWLPLASLSVLIAAIVYLNLDTWPPLLFFAIPIILTVSLFGWVEQQQMLQRVAKEQSRGKIKYLATVLERERIARDLHDILGHSLSCIALKAELTEKLLARGLYQEGQQHLNELSSTARDALSQVRQSVSGYKHQGLHKEIKKFDSRLRDAGFKLDVEGDIPPMSGHTETVVVLAITELVTNVLRHSNGQRCQLTFAPSPDLSELSVTLCDNGTNAIEHKGNGLQGIRERLQDLGGRLRLSRKDAWTCVELTLPIDKLHEQDTGVHTP